ncbi:MAG: NUDIX domain-containing protein [Paracoccaceae bacterium]
MRRIGEQPRSGIVYRDRPGVYAIITGPAGLLLCEQCGELQLPGGGVDPGEQPLAALHREVREETGWKIAGPDGGPPRRLDAFQRYTWLWDYHYHARKVQAIYLARAIAPLHAPLEPGHVAVWLAPEAATQALDIAGDRAVVRRALVRGLI